MISSENDKFIICKICNEISSINKITCQNCGSKLPSKNKGAVHFQIPFNPIFTKNKVINYKRSILEKAEIIKKNKADSKCGICLENMYFGGSLSKLSCKHIFHKNCLFTWLKYKNQCPFCRIRIKLINKNIKI